MVREQWAVGAGNATYHHYLFDVSMYTKIALTANATTLTATAVITGATSGATGILVTTVSGAAEMNSDASGRCFYR